MAQPSEGKASIAAFGVIKAGEIRNITLEFPAVLERLKSGLPQA